MVAARRIAPLVGLAAGYALAVRPRLVRWGATDEEVRRPSPGAELIPGGERSATMAVTIEAEPSRLWPWLVQMGADRGGWYSWDRLDNWGHASADRIHPEWQEISVGDRLAATPDGRQWWDVAALEPHQAPVDLPADPDREKGDDQRPDCIELERHREVSPGLCALGEPPRGTALAMVAEAQRAGPVTMADLRSRIRPESRVS